MKKALRELALTKAPITALIDDNPIRFYGNDLPQGLKTFPAVTCRTVSVTGRPTFDGASEYDFTVVDIHCYGRDRDDGTSGEDVANDLWEVIRKEMEDSKGTFAGVQIDYVRMSGGGHEDYLEKLNLHTKQLELTIGTHRNP